MAKVYVIDSVVDAQSFDTGNRILDSRAMSFYQNTFYLGDFETAEEACEAALDAEIEADEKVEAFFRENGLSDDLGNCGPCYMTHMYWVLDDGQQFKVEY